ncbi:MAG TPA: GAF domain-containing protein [Candidatus Angelobacter sp.]
MPHKYLAKEFEEFARSAASAESLMQHISQRIHEHIPRYNWVGFYLVDKKDAYTLMLGPYVGSFTPNPKISLDQGLCGSAASSGRTVVADNVAQDPRYLQASDLVRSQISAPVMVGGRAVGVFNVESYFMATFKSTTEREFVETCAKIAARCLEKTVAPAMVHV